MAYLSAQCQTNIGGYSFLILQGLPAAEDAACSPCFGPY